MGPITFGIRAITYRRPDGRTPELLARALDSVLAQKYRHWKVFLVGDRYEDDAEFESLAARIPPHRIFATNRWRRTERDVWSGHALWMCAGCGAANHSLDVMQGCGVEYVACLDHDDVWSPEHLGTLADCYARHPEAAFVCTQARHDRLGVVPANISEPCCVDGSTLESNVVHSATSWRPGLVPLRYRVLAEVAPWARRPGDLDLWLRIGDCLRGGPWTMMCVPKVTVWHQQSF